MKKKNLTRKEKLINVAMDEFIENSYDEASLNNILKEARISKGSFYYHFKNKKELYLYIYDQVVKDKISYLNEAMKETMGDISRKDIFTILRFLGKISLEFAVKYPKYYKLGKRIFEEKNEEIKVLTIVKAKSDESLILIEKLIKKAINNNELRDDFSVDFITRLLRHLMTNFSTICLDDMKDEIEGFDLDKILEVYDSYIDFIENGLGKKK
ncbi:TetR/AcrR family transcriptional regulator [Maledivibacter halophilus]|uniref:Transcriptional regulator, TetR family n=1 Tax=Maledivibacter halophilus TaxID=36842 RepID=A0A1T5IIP2_9FIRM|nr:TetR/AcrR family transcriptional regulator [Maledivibacter halophilus]SKC38970.1 transcriptional regulator, TetR family [Maledivibacter halophilus]